MSANAPTPANATAGRRYRGVSNEARKTERRMKLIDAGIRIFGTTGYHAATVKGICQEAGLTERYFYESFANAEMLFTACYLHITDTLKARLQAVLLSMDDEGLAHATATGLRVFFTQFKEQPEAARIILVEVLTVNRHLEELSLKTLYSFVDMLETLARPLIEQAKQGNKDAGQSAHLDSTLLASGLVGSVLYMAARWALDGCRQPVDHVVDNAMLIFTGVGLSLLGPGR